MRSSELLSGFGKDVNGRIVLAVRASSRAGWHTKVGVLLDRGVLIGDYFPWLAWLAAMVRRDAKVSRAFKGIDHILVEILEPLPPHSPPQRSAATRVVGRRRQ